MLEQDTESNLKKGNRKSSFKKGILLVNLGTPASFSPKDIRSYLDEFLSDPRVVDIPWLGRFLLLKLIILPFRPGKIAASYEHIWTKNGSPLLAYGEIIRDSLQKEMGEDYHIELAMRYGNPSLEKALEKFKSNQYESLLVLPLFPQYASASNASVIERVMNLIKGWPVIPSLKFISYFYNEDGFIRSFIEIGKTYKPEDYDHVLFSFHGLPERQIKAGDNYDYCKFNSCCETINEKNQYCYRAQCYQTAYLIADKLGLKKEDFSVSFQSRLGKTPWIKPYTDFHLKELAEKGYKKLLVFSPSFVSDCLETIYEIGVDYEKQFRSYGGEKLQLVESLNGNEIWINALKQIIIKNIC